MEGKKKTEKTFIGIREIARLADVSTATVSRVINHPEKCSEKSRSKVEKIIKEYNYVPNESIKRIFSKSSNTIAIFIQDINNPFYTRLIIELNNICFKTNYSLLICNTENNVEKEKAYLELCLARRCVGIILTEGLSTKLFENMDIPFVSLDRNENSHIPCVTSESYNSIRKVVNYLYNLGHRHIAFVGSEQGLCSVEIRFSGYADEMSGKSLPLLQEYIFREKTALDTRLGKRALQHFLSLPHPPTAVICANDMIALGVINQAAQMNIEIPHDLSVCGFDHVLDDFLPIPLTTVEQNIPQLAQELFNFLINPDEQAQTKIVDTVFIPGYTCGKAAEPQK